MHDIQPQYAGIFNPKIIGTIGWAIEIDRIRGCSERHLVEVGIYWQK
jgi:hypothetical protein